MERQPGELGELRGDLLAEAVGGVDAGPDRGPAGGERIVAEAEGTTITSTARPKLSLDAVLPDKSPSPGASRPSLPQGEDKR
jgi:hypothetical protein